MEDAKILREDPVYEKNGEWYFWDETWSTSFGPFKTEDIARTNCVKYKEIIG